MTNAPQPTEHWLDGGGGRLFTRHWRPANTGSPKVAMAASW